MKLLTIQLADTADLASFVANTKINVSNPSSTTEGVVLAVTSMADPPEAGIVPHDHPSVVKIGPAEPLS